MPSANSVIRHAGSLNLAKKNNREALPYRTLDEFMQDVALITDADDKDKEDRNHVSLMTIHAAKGA